MQFSDKGISIIVPTYGRVNMIERLLLSLREARGSYNGDTEVLLIDSSNNEDKLKIEILCKSLDAKIYSSLNHVCIKRNIGIAKARFDRLFFIDSDCEADSNVLISLDEYMKTLKEPSAVLGFTGWVGPKTKIWKIIDMVSGFGSAFNFAKWFKVVPWGTCTNLFIEKSWLIKIGGFDESLPIKVFGDDVDLGLRLKEAGCTIRCNPEAVVNHSRLPYQNFLKVITKYFLSGRADYHLGNRHPENLKRDFPGPVLIALLLFIMAIVRVFLGFSVWSILIPFSWLIIFLLFSSFILIIVKKRGLSMFHYQFLALFPTLSFEVGKIYESLFNLSPGAILLKFVYINEQLKAERSWKLISLCIIIITFPIALVLFLFC